MTNEIQNIESSFKVLTDRAKGDRYIWACVALLVIVSLLVVYSATGGILSQISKRSTSVYLFEQIVFSIVGLVAIYFLHRVNYILYSRIAVICYLISIPLLIYTLFYGTALNGGSRWIKFPVINMTFQTSEFAKLALFMFLSRQLSRRQKVIKDLKKGFLPLITPVAITCLLMFPAGLTNALLTFITALILMFIGRVNLKHIFLTILIISIFLGIIIVSAVSYHHSHENESTPEISKNALFKRVSTWRNRTIDFLYPNPQKNFTQSQQVKIAIANGSVFHGLGPGNSRQRNFLSEAYNDFIFAIIIEEYGLLGAVFIMFIYLVFLYRSIRIFNKCPYAFGAFLALGLSFTLVIQAIFNMAVNVGFIPTTGVTLPLISKGGTSFLFICAAIGIILSVASNVEKIEGKARQQSVVKEKENSAVIINNDLDNGK